MATGQEPASAANVRALYQRMSGGGVAPSWISDLKELRKEMGLGDTLGVLPIENMQLKVSDEVSGLSAADGYAISPKGVYDFMNELLNKEKSGARLYSDDGGVVATANGEALTVSGSSIKVNVSNPYVVTASYDNSQISGNVTASAFVNINGKAFSLGSAVSGESSGWTNVSAAGSAVIYLKKGDVLSIPYDKYGKIIYNVSISEQ